MHKLAAVTSTMQHDFSVIPFFCKPELQGVLIAYVSFSAQMVLMLIRSFLLFRKHISNGPRKRSRQYPNKMMIECHLLHVSKTRPTLPCILQLALSVNTTRIILHRRLRCQHN